MVRTSNRTTKPANRFRKHAPAPQVQPPARDGNTLVDLAADGCAFAAVADGFQTQAQNLQDKFNDRDWDSLRSDLRGLLLYVELMAAADEKAGTQE